jgi:hypothetical protein
MHCQMTYDVMTLISLEDTHFCHRGGYIASHIVLSLSRELLYGQ